MTDAWTCALRLQDGANVSLDLSDSGLSVEALNSDFTVEAWFRLEVGAMETELDRTIAHFCEVILLITSTTAWLSYRTPIESYYCRFEADLSHLPGVALTRHSTLLRTLLAAVPGQGVLQGQHSCV